MGGGGWAKVMALSLALSVIATTGTGIVLTARIVYGMASYRVLPAVPGQRVPPVLHPGRGQHRRRRASSSRITWVYLLATSVQNAFNDVVDVTGLLFAAFYILTALATIVYYRRRVLARPGTR